MASRLGYGLFLPIRGGLVNDPFLASLSHLQVPDGGQCVCCTPIEVQEGIHNAITTYTKAAHGDTDAAAP